jgi:hypothetical protein
MSAWNMFVKKIYWEGKKKDKNYEFKQALQDASRRKGEMGSSSTRHAKSKMRKTNKNRRSRRTRHRR